METRITRLGGKSCFIGNEHPLAIIGERINPTGKKKLTQELSKGDFSMVRHFAFTQAKAGAHIIDINVGAAGVDEKKVLPLAVRIVMETVDLPLSIDSANPKALEAALKIYKGRAVINSVTGEMKSLDTILPLVKKYKAVVLGLTFDESGPQNDPQTRFEVAKKILKEAQRYGIPQEDVLIDCLARPVSLGKEEARCTLEAIKLVNQELGVNTVLGISNISFGLPDRKFLNAAFLAMAVAQGLNCAILDPTINLMK
ncbi:MAG: dihydropteroate synthase, partial [Candidatus Aminicenantales bacterium]